MIHWLCKAELPARTEEALSAGKENTSAVEGEAFLVPVTLPWSQEGGGETQAGPAEDPVPLGPVLLGSQETARDEPVKPISPLGPFFPKLPRTDAGQGFS